MEQSGMKMDEAGKEELQEIPPGKGEFYAERRVQS